MAAEERMAAQQAVQEAPQQEVQEAPQQAVQIDVDVDGGTAMEWEVETEPAQDAGYTETVTEEVYEEPYEPYDQGIPVAKRMNKHLFTWLLSFYLGIFGADRFYRGQPVLGMAKLLTFGGFGFWYMADLVIAVIKSYGEGFRDMDDLMFDQYGRYIY